MPLPCLGAARTIEVQKRSQTTSANGCGNGRGVWRLAEGAFPASCEHLQLKDRFKESLSMSGEVRLLAGDRVVSHERSRPAALPRQDLRPPHAGPYPSDYCGCVSWRALLAGDHRCREAVTARHVNSIDAFEAGNQLLRRRIRPSRMIHRCGQIARTFAATKPPRPIISFRTAITLGR